jgi:hypothetical protein
VLTPAPSLAPGVQTTGRQVRVTCWLLLVSLPSHLPCLRQRIPGVAPGLRFLGNPAHRRLRLTPAPRIVSRRATDGLLRSGGSFCVAVGRCYAERPGFAGVNPGRCDSRQAPSLYRLVKPITRVGLFLITMIQTHLRLRYPWRLARRDVRIGFPDDLLFTPLCGLRISRYRRGDAIPRSLGAGNLAQHRASSCQGSDHLAFHPQACACFERTDRTSPIKIRTTARTQRA